jgi:TolB-like protein
MASFFAELKRRNMYRVAAAYAVVTWVLLQVFNNVAPILELPAWIGRAVLLLLVMGFPAALLFVWMRELAPVDSAAAQAKANKLDWILAGGVAAVIAIFLFQQFAPNALPGRSPQPAASAAKSAPGSPAGAVSIAVLPFVNLSDDRQQEFFSDGMTEELTSALAKIPDLVVIGRTSAFQFKGRNEDLRAIGQALNASYLIEGSVRRAADRVRITAQLIRADSGAHLWTENYDRNLTDIFATQEDIAHAIAGALRVPLGLQQGESLVASRGIDPESYQQYLRAKTLLRARTNRAVTEGAALLEQVVAREPNYAPGWALLALAYDVTPNSHPSWHSGAVDQLKPVVEASLPRAEIAARRAIELDPENADAYAALGRALVARGKFVEVEDLYKKALELDPNNPDALNLYGNLLAVVGRFQDALAIKERLQTLDPFVPVFSDNAAITLWLDGQTEVAISLLRTQGPGINRRALARLYAAAGRYNEAADALLEIPAGTFLLGTIEDAVRLLRSAPSPAPSPQALPPLGTLDFVYLHVGAPERVLDFYESNANAGFAVAIFTANLWDPAYANIRKTDRFKALVRKNGLVEYWRARGWPQQCHPTTGDDFECG